LTFGWSRRDSLLPRDRCIKARWRWAVCDTWKTSRPLFYRKLNEVKPIIDTPCYVEYWIEECACRMDEASAEKMFSFVALPERSFQASTQRHSMQAETRAATPHIIAPSTLQKMNSSRFYISLRIIVTRILMLDNLCP